MSKSRARINVFVSDETLAMVERTARVIDAQTRGEVVRRAIRLMDTLTQHRRGDGTVIVERSDGERLRVVL